MTNENAYQAPADTTPANHSRFSDEELRYMAKVFVAWLVGFAMWSACITVAQLHYALQAFSADRFVVSLYLTTLVFSEGVRITFVAAVNTLVMVTERRANREIIQPVQSLPWWVAAIWTLAVPLGMLIAFGVSLLLVAFVLDIDSAAFSEPLRTSIGRSDIPLPVIQIIPMTLLLMFGTAPLMRLQFRFRGWLILKLLVATVLVGLAVRLFCYAAFWVMPFFDETYKLP